MDILHAFGSVLSVAGGGITGILGGGLQLLMESGKKKLEIEEKKIQNEHELKMLEANAKIMQLEFSARTQVAETEAHAAIETADAAAFAAGFKMEPQRYAEGLKANAKQAWMMFWLDFARGVVRPALTLYLCGITTAVYFQARKIMDGVGMSPEQAYANLDLIIQTVLYLTTTCVLWWFSTRNKQEAPKIR